MSELGVADVTLEQFEKLAKASGCDCELTPDGLDIGDYRRLLATCMLSLEYLLKVRRPAALSTDAESIC